MSPKETAYIVERLAVRFMSMVADYERKMVEHRDAFGVRTSADAKIIDGLRAAADEQVLSASKVAYVLRCAGETPVQAAQRVVKERDGLLTQVQDQRAEIERLRALLRNDVEACYAEAIKVPGELAKDRDSLRRDNAQLRKEHDADLTAIVGLLSERDKLRAEVAALRAEVADLRGIFDMVHASLGIKRGDHIGKAIEALKAHTPKRSHPVAVGGYLRRLSGFNTTPAGEVARVLYVDCDGPATEYTVKRPNGQQGVWSESGCEPCDPPGSTHAEPDLTQLHAKGKEAWSDVPNATQWVEDMRGNTEASHDTPAGKEAAESAAEIKVGDVVEVVSNKGIQTWESDIGSMGKVRDFEPIDDCNCVRLENLPGKRNALGGYVSLCDVRKVPQ